MMMDLGMWQCYGPIPHIREREKARNTADKQSDDTLSDFKKKTPKRNFVWPGNAVADLLNKNTMVLHCFALVTGRHHWPHHPGNPHSAER